MTSIQPGWYPDPDDPQARRYWDGQAWSAPLPIGQNALPDSDSESRELVGWEKVAAERGTAIPASTTCAVATCRTPRFNGELYCLQHGPSKRTSATNAPSPVGDGALVCPHCQARGAVSSRRMKAKKGVSGAKLTGAAFTAGFSLIATGLSRKEHVTEMRCGRCRTTWQV